MSVILFHQPHFCITITILLQGSFCTVVFHKKEKYTSIPYVWHITALYLLFWDHVIAPLVEVLRYQPGGRGFDFRWFHRNFLFM